MKRSCGDDCVDQLNMLTNSLHNVTSVLEGREVGYTLERAGCGEMSIELDTPEGMACNQEITSALEKYKNLKLENLSAMALGKLEENNLKGPVT